jgi:hypothetical protein
MARPAWARWAWFWGLWAASVATLGLVAGVLKLVFGAILR